MIEAGLARLQTLFSRRFIVGTFFPLVLLVVASGAVYLAVTGSWARVLAAFADLPGTTQALLLAGCLLLLASAAHVLSSFHLVLTRLYEGYWPREAAVDRLRAWAVRRQRSDLDRLATAERSARDDGRDYDASALQLRMGQSFPPPTRLDALMPTRLGNVLRAAELYPHERYRIDAAVIWPRLRLLLPEAAADGLVEAQTALESLLLLRTLAAMFGLVAPVALVLAGASWLLVLASLLAWPVSWISHRSALQAAVEYADRIRTAFDLYRLDLLKHLEIEVPADLAAERMVWDDLTQFYFRNLPLSGSAGRGLGSADGTPA